MIHAPGHQPLGDFRIVHRPAVDLDTPVMELLHQFLRNRQIMAVQIQLVGRHGIDVGIGDLLSQQVLCLGLGGMLADVDHVLESKGDKDHLVQRIHRFTDFHDSTHRLFRHGILQFQHADLVGEDKTVLVMGLCNDAIGYIVPDNDYAPFIADSLWNTDAGEKLFGEPHRHYEEMLSAGSKAGSSVIGALNELVNNVK